MEKTFTYDNNLRYSYGFDRQRMRMEEFSTGWSRTKDYVGRCEFVTENGASGTDSRSLTFVTGPCGVFAVVEDDGLLRLTHNQYSIMKSLASKLIYKYDWSDNWANDAWGCTLMVDNQVYYKDNNYSIDRTPMEIKLLIEYIISISPIQIELYSFS